MTPLTQGGTTFPWAPAKTTFSLDLQGKRGFRGRGGAAKGATIRACADGSDPQLVTTTSSPALRAYFLEKVACQLIEIDKPLFRQSQDSRPSWGGCPQFVRAFSPRSVPAVFSFCSGAQLCRIPSSLFLHSRLKNVKKLCILPSIFPLHYSRKGDILFSVP